METRPTLILGGLALLAYLALVLLTHDAGVGREVEPGTRSHPYVVEDTYDRLAYQQRGRWIASGGTPYLEEFSEYPQLTTWLAALPYLFFNHGVERGEPFGSIEAARAVLSAGGVPPERARELCPLPQPGLEPRTPEALAAELAAYPKLDRPAARAAFAAAETAEERRKAELTANRKAYGDWHHGLMALWFFGLLVCVTHNLRRLGEPAGYALCLLLPASLYFGFNRFDLVVTTVVALALALELGGAPRRAAFVLGLAVMVKWAPIVLVPLFLSHNAWRLREGGDAWPRALARGVLVPGLLAALAIALPLAITYAWDGGGSEALAAAFEWHKNVRQPNHSSLLALLTAPDRWAWFEPASRSSLESVFKLLQLLPGVLLALLPLRTPRALISAALTATLCAIVFSEFFSPQWVLWVTALALYLAPRQRAALVLLVALEVVMYLQLPWFYYHMHATGDARGFAAATNARMLLLLVFLAAAALWTLRAAFRPQRLASV
jgi:hypothetical protein